MPAHHHPTQNRTHALLKRERKLVLEFQQNFLACAFYVNGLYIAPMADSNAVFLTTHHTANASDIKHENKLNGLVWCTAV